MNLDRIEAVLRLLERQVHVGEVEIEGDGWRVAARRGAGFFPPPLEEGAPEDALSNEPDFQSIRSAMVGVFRAPATPLRPGDTVLPGATVGSIDAMRMLTPVVAEQGGSVLEALVEEGDPVEYGQELFRLRERSASNETAR